MTRSQPSSSDGSTTETTGPSDGTSTQTTTSRSDGFDLHTLAKHVSGHVFDTPNGLYYPVVMSDRPEHGDVSRFLDGLPRDRRVVFPTVIHGKLRAMLLRRGFVDAVENDETFGRVDVMERKP